MLAAVDTPTCLRRSDKFNLEQQKGMTSHGIRCTILYVRPPVIIHTNCKLYVIISARVCDQMGDLNIWASVLPSNQSKPYIKENGFVDLFF